ncbi:MAG: hypothetical protein ACPGU1_23280, partial [Myxococcota bacterium]
MRNASKELRPDGQQRPAEGATTTTAPSARSADIKEQLRGEPFDVQTKMLSPVQRRGEGGAPAESIHAIAERGVSGAGSTLPHL